MTNKAKCRVANEFLLSLDKHLATIIVTDIPCKDVLTMVDNVSRGAPTDVARTVKQMISRELGQPRQCKDDVISVDTLRRVVARIRCDERAHVSYTRAPKDEPQIPRGFVRPRLWNRSWTSGWAAERGWISDPHYGWLMPVFEKQQRRRGRPTTYVPLPRKRAETITLTHDEIVAGYDDYIKQYANKPRFTKATVPKAVEVPKPEVVIEKPKAVAKKVDEIVIVDDPKAVEPPKAEVVAEAPKDEVVIVDNERFNKKTYLAWSLGALAIAVVLGLLGWYWWHSGSPKTFGPEDVDRAFDNSAPPTTDMSLNNSNVPNTTELMNDLVSPKTTSSPRF